LPASKLVRSSHERFDGEGYPDGLVGAAIPLGSRIIAVCDAYDAMVSDRPYRSSLRSAQALAELRRCAGAQFDPEVVEVFGQVVLEAERRAMIA
jgi:HD-GYP domain-containing protein (c-di-GMP phosphodiesterase class II)